MIHPSSPRRAAEGIALVGLLVGLPGLAACGDPGVPLSEWVKEADAICAELQTEADLVRPELFTPPLQDTLRKSSELSKREASRLRDLPAPAGDARIQARDYVATLDERNTTLDLLATSVELASSDAPADTAKLAELTQSAADKALALGLTECRSGVDLSVGGSSAGAEGPAPTMPADGAVPETAPTSLPNEFGTEDGADG